MEVSGAGLVANPDSWGTRSSGRRDKVEQACGTRPSILRLIVVPVAVGEIVFLYRVVVVVLNYHSIAAGERPLIVFPSVSTISAEVALELRLSEDARERCCPVVVGVTGFGTVFELRHVGRIVSRVGMDRCFTIDFCLFPIAEEVATVDIVVARQQLVIIIKGAACECTIRSHDGVNSVVFVAIAFVAIARKNLSFCETIALLVKIHLRNGNAIVWLLPIGIATFILRVLAYLPFVRVLLNFAAEKIWVFWTIDTKFVDIYLFPFATEAVRISAATLKSSVLSCGAVDQAAADLEYKAFVGLWLA